MLCVVVVWSSCLYELCSVMSSLLCYETAQTHTLLRSQDSWKISRPAKRKHNRTSLCAKYTDLSVQWCVSCLHILNWKWNKVKIFTFDYIDCELFIRWGIIYKVLLCILLLILMPSVLLSKLMIVTVFSKFKRSKMASIFHQQFFSWENKDFLGQGAFSKVFKVI